MICVVGVTTIKSFILKTIFMRDEIPSYFAKIYIAHISKNALKTPN